MFEPKGCEDQIGPHVKRLNHAIGRLFRKNAGENGLDEATVISGRIMSLIYFSDETFSRRMWRTRSTLTALRSPVP